MHDSAPNENFFDVRNSSINQQNILQEYNKFKQQYNDDADEKKLKNNLSGLNQKVIKNLKEQRLTYVNYESETYNNSVIRIKNDTLLNSDPGTLDIQENAMSSCYEDKSKTVEFEDIKKLFKQQKKKAPITEQPSTDDLLFIQSNTSYSIDQGLKSKHFVKINDFIEKQKQNTQKHA